MLDYLTEFPNTLHNIQNDIVSIISIGGPVVALLFIFSIFALAIIVAKSWQFKLLKMGDQKTQQHVLKLYHANKKDRALDLALSSANPVTQVLASAIQFQQHPDSPSKNEQHIREEIERLARARLATLRSYLKPLEIIASLAPLLGLFGTVLGMIKAFQQLSQAGSQVDPAILSGGIWEALLTTAVGLAVAIPTVAALSWLERRIERTSHQMEDGVTQIFTTSLKIQ